MWVSSFVGGTDLGAGAALLNTLGAEWVASHVQRSTRKNNIAYEPPLKFETHNSSAKAIDNKQMNSCFHYKNPHTQLVFDLLLKIWMANSATTSFINGKEGIGHTNIN